MSNVGIKLGWSQSTHSHIEKYFDINVVCPWGGFLSVAHSGISIVVFIKESGCLLGDVEIPEKAPDK